ncbi:MAG: esterase-like activity of phytase family protein [Hyphomicrobiales bacterium]
MRRWRAALAALVFSLPMPALADDGGRPVALTCHPIPSFHIWHGDETRFGPLEWLGGIEIEPDSGDFGGFSALGFVGDRLVSVSDSGLWLTARLVEDAAGRPTCLADAELRSLPGIDGEPLFSKENSDAESMAFGSSASGPVVYVGFEGRARILAFPLDAAGVPGRPTPVAVNFKQSELRYTKGLEALALAPEGHPLAGTLVALSERTLDKRRNILAWLVGGPTPGPFTVLRQDDFDITDADFLPDGDLLLLERRFRPSDGVAMRVSRVKAEALKPGVLVEPEVLMTANMAYQIDNMEGIRVSRNAAGETLVTVISDDNHSVLQRNLLLRFIWRGN